MSEALRSSSIEAIGTTAVVVVADSAALADARAILLRELAQIDRACSRFRDDSELALLNRSAGAERGVSALLFEAIVTAVRAAEMTAGLVSPTVGRTLRLAGYDTTFTLVARRDGRTFEPRFAAVADWRRIELDEERRTIRVPRDVELDLGATAKALAADRIARAATHATACGVLVSLGGDVSVSGPAPTNGWPIRLADDHRAPLSTDGPSVSISTGGLATSSTRVRRWSSAGGELHHIVDPRTGRPADTSWQTVTVAAASSVDANVAATAAVVLGEDAVAWLEQRHLPARLVARDGAVSYAAGWQREAA